MENVLRSLYISSACNQKILGFTAGRFLLLYDFCIFSKMGMTCSKDGRFPGSSFMQIPMSFAMWGETPTGSTSSRSPSVAI